MTAGWKAGNLHAPHRLTTSWLGLLSTGVNRSKTGVAGSNKYIYVYIKIPSEVSQVSRHSCPKLIQLRTSYTFVCTKTRWQKPKAQERPQIAALFFSQCWNAPALKSSIAHGLCLCAVPFLLQSKESDPENKYENWSIKKSNCSNAKAIAKERNRQYQNPWPVPAQENTLPPLADQIIVKFMCNVTSLSHAEPVSFRPVTSRHVAQIHGPMLPGIVSKQSECKQNRHNNAYQYTRIHIFSTNTTRIYKVSERLKHKLRFETSYPCLFYLFVITCGLL